MDTIVVPKMFSRSIMRQRTVEDTQSVIDEHFGDHITRLTSSIQTLAASFGVAGDVGVLDDDRSSVAD